jgi:hypothetical protein
MHGLTHVPGGSDPIPGLVLTGSETYPDKVLNHPCLQHYWRGDITDQKGSWDLAVTTDTVGADTYPQFGDPGPITDPDGGSILNAGLNGASADVCRLHYGTGTDPDAIADGDTGFTVELWARLDTFNNGTTIFSQYLLVLGSGGPGLIMYLSSDNKLHVGYGAADLSVAVPLDTWLHIAVRYDGTTLQLLLGNVVVGSVAEAGTTINDNVTWLGKNETTWAPWNGSSSDLALYSCALTDSELAGHINAAGPTADLSAKVDRDAVVTATARLVAVKLLAGDTQPAFRILGDGTIEWGQGGTTAPDTKLYRSGNSLRTDSTLIVAQTIYAGLGAAAGTAGLNLRATGDSIDRYVVDNTGKMLWGPGGAAADTNLYRLLAAYLRTQGSLVVDNELYVDYSGAGYKLRFGSPSDTFLYRSGINNLKTDGNFRSADSIYATWSLVADHGGSGGRVYFGSALDASLYRDRANVVRTDGLFQTNLFSVTTAAGAVSGAQANKFPIYNAGGGVVGYVPLYAA